MTKAVFCPQCGIEIKMDALGFPIDNILMCKNTDGTASEVHLKCYIQHLELA